MSCVDVPSECSLARNGQEPHSSCLKFVFILFNSIKLSFIFQKFQESKLVWNLLIAGNKNTTETGLSKTANLMAQVTKECGFPLSTYSLTKLCLWTVPAPLSLCFTSLNTKADKEDDFPHRSGKSLGDWTFMYPFNDKVSAQTNN